MWFLIRFFESYCFRIFDFFWFVLDFRWFNLVKIECNIVVSSNIVIAIAFVFSSIVDLNFLFSNYIWYEWIECSYSNVDNNLIIETTTFDFECVDNVENVNKNCVNYKIRILQNLRWNVLIVICWIANEFDEF